MYMLFVVTTWRRMPRACAKHYGTCTLHVSYGDKEAYSMHNQETHQTLSLQEEDMTTTITPGLQTLCAFE